MAVFDRTTQRFLENDWILNMEAIAMGAPQPRISIYRRGGFVEWTTFFCISLLPFHRFQRFGAVGVDGDQCGDLQNAKGEHDFGAYGA